MKPKSLSTNPKTSSKKATSDSRKLIKKIQELENQIKISQDKDLNPIADLNNHFTNTLKQTQKLTTQSQSQPEAQAQAQVIHTLIYSLHRIFSTLIRQGRIHASPIDSGSAQESVVKVVKDWLKSQYQQYIDNLLSLLRLKINENQIELDSLTILMNLVRSESDLFRSFASQSPLQDSNAQSHFPLAGFESSTFLKILKALILPTSNQNQQPIPQSVRAEFILRYLNFCDDIRYRFLKEVSLICKSHNPESTQNQTKKKVDNKNLTELTRNLLTYLESITTMPTEAEELNQFWTGKNYLNETTTDTKKKKRKNKSNQESSNKKIKVESDGTTGIFDDPIDSSSSEEEEKESSQSITKLNKNKNKNPLLCLKSHQKVFSEAWISFLSLQSLDKFQIKRVLKILHDQVIPNMIDPKILMDFLVDCLDYGGTISVLSLNALFTLMSKHNLDYPDFYTRLYEIMDSEVLHTRHRPRFFRMLEIFLSSTHLPVNIVASFMKKLARLSLFGPPGAIITTVPMCYNLIKQHPTAMSMLHRAGQPHSNSLLSEISGVSDPYKIEERDPIKSNAIKSSMWELQGLRSHYLSSISTLFKIFQESFDKPKFELEDFLDHTYSTLIGTEFAREIKKPPALSLFVESVDLKNNQNATRISSSTINPTPTTTTTCSNLPNDIVNQIWQV